MGVCTFFDKSMKVLSSILVGMAAAQWEGFNEYDYSDVGKNQASQVNVLDVLAANAGGSNLAAGYTLPNHYLGNGLKCWFCNSRSVHDCFDSNTFTVCQGQEYFCFYHERRKISHYFNRREKYIDHFASGQSDPFLGRRANEAFNQDSDNGGSASDVADPQTLIHVMAGCQQPQACLRQQNQNNPITIGVAFYGVDATVGASHLPTSRRNVREGLCRLGKDWTYYSGHHWMYATAAVVDNANTNLPTTRKDMLDADQEDGHQFYDERESWYNGMRPNGFPQERHGGKGTESVCHFCCDPAVEGQWCNRKALDGKEQTVDGLQYSTGNGVWRNSPGTGILHTEIRADNEALSYANTPAMSSWLTSSPWLSKMRYHGQWRNPETQVSQNFREVEA